MTARRPDKDAQTGRVVQTDRVAQSGRVVRIGTRGSALALAQALLVADALAAHGVSHETVLVETEGDRRAPDTAWGEGAFVTAIERALLDGRADVAVHSAKDVPTDENPQLRICAYLPRADARDALVLAAAAAPATVDTIAAGSVVGTDSPRRAGFLRARRPDLAVRPLHGNVDTRLGRLDGGAVDALILAVAGLERLDRADRISERIAPEVLPPAPGQGAIAIQVRSDDPELLALGELLDDRPTRLAVETERAFLRAAGGGCRAPVGAFAQILDGQLVLRGGFATVDGRAVAVDTATGPVTESSALAEELAAVLSARRAHLAGGPRVLVTRPREQSRRLAARLAEYGVEGIIVPGIEIELSVAGGALDRELARLTDFDWVVVTSANGARAVAAAAARVGADLSTVRWAAVGDATARVLMHAGIATPWRPSTSSGDNLASELPLVAGEHLLLPRGTLAGDELPTSLRRRGAIVTEVESYATREAPDDSRGNLHEALGTSVDAVLFASPSAVRGLLALAGAERQVAMLSVPAMCIGPTTAAAAREAGFTVLAEAATQDEAVLAEMAAGLLAQPATGVPATGVPA